MKKNFRFIRSLAHVGHVPHSVPRVPGTLELPEPPDPPHAVATLRLVRARTYAVSLWPAPDQQGGHGGHLHLGDGNFRIMTLKDFMYVDIWIKILCMLASELRNFKRFHVCWHQNEDYVCWHHNNDILKDSMFVVIKIIMTVQWFHVCWHHIWQF